MIPVGVWLTLPTDDHAAGYQLIVYADYSYHPVCLVVNF